MLSNNRIITNLSITQLYVAHFILYYYPKGISNYYSQEIMREMNLSQMDKFSCRLEILG